MSKVKLQESGYEIEVTEEMLQEMSQFGDIPSDWGVDPQDCAWVSVDYARTDPHWSNDIPEGYPDHLPLWESRS